MRSQATAPKGDNDLWTPLAQHLSISNQSGTTLIATPGGGERGDLDAARFGPTAVVDAAVLLLG